MLFPVISKISIIPFVEHVTFESSCDLNTDFIVWLLLVVTLRLFGMLYRLNLMG